MSNEYYTPYNPVKNGVRYGIILGLCVVVIWWYWAYTEYRWSEARLSNKMRQKYERKYMFELLKDSESPMSDKAEFEKDKDIAIIDVVVDQVNMIATGKGVVRKKENLQILDSVDLRYTLYTDDSECTAFTASNCIVV